MLAPEAAGTAAPGLRPRRREEGGTHLEQVAPRLHFALSPRAGDPHVPEPGSSLLPAHNPHASSIPYLCPPAGRVTPWERALAQRGGRETGRGGGETWEFPTMHLCRLHEDGEQGGGERTLQSRGKGWDLEGQDAKAGGAGW